MRPVDLRSIFNYEDYRTYLRDVLADRKSVNIRYSLRAFARDLGITPQTLSLVLKNKRKLSLSSGAQIAQNLNLKASAAAYFLDLIMVADMTDDLVREIVVQRLRHERHASLDGDVSAQKFKQLANWYHFAVLELMKSEDFQKEDTGLITFIARRLGVTHETPPIMDDEEVLSFHKEMLFTQDAK